MNFLAQNAITVLSEPRVQDGTSWVPYSNQYLTYEFCDTNGRLSDQIPMAQMIAAIEYGMAYSVSYQDIASTGVPSDCSTSNCTFPPYQSSVLVFSTWTPATPFG